MKWFNGCLAIWLSCLLLPAAAWAYDVPPAKQTKLGKYLTAVEAAEVVMAEKNSVLFLDVRARSEIQFVGYTSEIDGVVPWVDMTTRGEWDDAGGRLKLEPNLGFSKAVGALLSRKGLAKDQKVILICRSGDRSAKAANLLAEAGYTNVYSVIEGFEGDLSADGRRTVNGWKNAGLPWTYKLDKAKMFPPVE